ncbi:MAG: AAA family ATPase [Bacteroidaceae bacterium]|nr:AAA family ATPase [Bacteroidaceae bacterium]
MATLASEQKIGGYTVIRLVKENLYTETYEVRDEERNRFFLKLFALKRMPAKLVGKDGQVHEIGYSKQLKHRRIVSFVEEGEYQSDEGRFPYLITDFINGTLINEKLQQGAFPEEEALAIYRQMLEGLFFMHQHGIIHNDITPRNVFINALTGEAEIIDLGHASERCSGSVPFDTVDLDVFYCANETFAGLYDEQSDIFSATAVLYTMLTGNKPWMMELSESMSRGRKGMLLKEKRKSEPIDFSIMNVGKRTQVILAKGMALPTADRYDHIQQIFNDLDSKEMPKETEHRQEDRPQQGGGQTRHDDDSYMDQSPNKVEFEIKRGNGQGFKDIAGMQELKDYLTQRIIFVIKNKEKAEKYRLTTPNGMLLYGPPGCGKSFVAEKFAEETGFNYIFVKSSDLASSFVHGSQEKIAQLFKQAADNAPVVICFDEFDALVPDRSNPAAQYSSGEVNEFLTQLNNCAQRGIFVVGTTNRPDKIDPAVLRTGRIDKQVYVPLPDKEARKEMFLMHLKGRPYNANEIDAEKLSEMSDGYIASDIAYVVNDAAMVAAFTDKDITEELLETSVKSTRPSLRKDTMQIYEDIRRKMENTERSNLTRPRIGFK